MKTRLIKPEYMYDGNRCVVTQRTLTKNRIMNKLGNAVRAYHLGDEAAIMRVDRWRRRCHNRGIELPGGFTTGIKGFLSKLGLSLPKRYTLP